MQVYAYTILASLSSSPPPLHPVLGKHYIQCSDILVQKQTILACHLIIIILAWVGILVSDGILLAAERKK